MAPLGALCAGGYSGRAMTILDPSKTRLDALWREFAEAAGIWGARPDFRFDPGFYRFRHPHLDAAGAEAQYREAGRTAGEPGTFYQMLRGDHPKIDGVLRRLAIEPRLCAALAADTPDAPQLVCELIRLGAPIDAQISDFSMTAYAKWHPDIVAAGLDPLLHYLLYGAEESTRRTLADVRRNQRRGGQSFRPDRPTCLIAVHEMVRTGAPVVGLDLVRQAAQDNNVVVTALRGGPMEEAFLAEACEVLLTETPATDMPFFQGPAVAAIDRAVLNSFGCAPFVPALVAADIPFATYLHEYSEYCSPLWATTVLALFSDLIVFSSQHVRASWAGQFLDVEANLVRDSAIIAQRPVVMTTPSAPEIAAARARVGAAIGRDLGEARLVCGAGLAQWRKGPDLFIIAAQIARRFDPEVVFLWIGDGLNHEDREFGVWFDVHLQRAGANAPDGHLFFVPAGPLYLDVMRAADALFLSSRMDPLPNVAFDAVAAGCEVVFFEDASGFSDPGFQEPGVFHPVPYADPLAAAEQLCALPRKRPGHSLPAPPAAPPVFAQIDQRLRAQLAAHPAPPPDASPAIDLPMLCGAGPEDAPLRAKERAKAARYRRRYQWRDPDEAAAVLATSGNWVHAACRVAPLTPAAPPAQPFAMHLHAYYTDGLTEDLAGFAAFAHAARILVTTDTADKAAAITDAFAAAKLPVEVQRTPNRGRDVLPFLDLFAPGGPGHSHARWLHIHRKKTPLADRTGDVWRRFLWRILLGDAQAMSSAGAHLDDPGTGLVAPFEPHFVPWNASRRLLPQVTARLPGPLPDNPLLFPVGNMFWITAQVATAMGALFGPDYPWPNEPLASDGTVYHLIERLWPAVTASCGRRAVFVHKLDEPRVAT